MNKFSTTEELEIVLDQLLELVKNKKQIEKILSIRLWMLSISFNQEMEKEICDLIVLKIEELKTSINSVI